MPEILISSLSDEMLYEGGLILIAAAVVMGVLIFLVHRIRSMRLRMRFLDEYGPEEKR